MKKFSVLLIALLFTTCFAMAEMTKADKVIESVADKAEEITDTTIYSVQNGAQIVKDKSIETQEKTVDYTKKSVKKVKKETIKKANEISNSAAKGLKRAAEKVQNSADKTIEKTDKTINEIEETELK